jgi:hypothetical protein
MRLLHLWVFISALLFAGAAVAQEPVTERVQFASGQSGTTIRGSLQGYESVQYLLGAAAGQRMIVNMITSNPSTYFNIFAPGDAPGRSEAMFIAASSGLYYEGVLPESGDYMLQVFINRNAARRDESTTYTLDVRIEGAAGAGQDFADGLSGGPDYWEVTGVSGSLNIRTAPSTSAPVRIGLLRGTVVQNLGCRMNEGRRWCEVAQLGGGVTGWAAGEYLREAAAPQQPVIPPAGSGGAGSGADPLLAAAEQACMRDVRQMTNNPDAVVLRSMFSEAGTEVIVGIGAQRAPWRCIAYRDGTTAGIMSVTDEGSL